MSINTVDTANQLLAENAKLNAEVARLNEQVRALAAEVQNCRRFVVEHLGPDSGIEFSHLDNKFAESIMSEIRAQAVEGFAQKICSPYEDRGGETYQDGFNGAVDVMLKKAVKYAARIRAGEVSNG